MQFLFIHWHCILPVIGIVVAFFLMRDKPKKEREKQDSISNLPQENNRD